MGDTAFASSDFPSALEEGTAAEDPTPKAVREHAHPHGAVQAPEEHEAHEPHETHHHAHATGSKPALRGDPHIHFILTTGAAWLSGVHPFPQGGHALDENGFALQGLEFGGSMAVNPYFGVRLSIELAHLHLEEAYLTLAPIPGTQDGRIGYFNSRFGHHNAMHFHSWRFINPVLSHSRFMDEEAFSAPGMAWTVTLPLAWESRIAFELLSTSGQGAFRSATFGTVEMTESGRLDGLEDFVYVGRWENDVSFAAHGEFNWNASGAWGQSPFVPDNRAALWGADLGVQWLPGGIHGSSGFRLTSEGILRQTQIPEDAPQDWGADVSLEVLVAPLWSVAIRGDVADVLGKTPEHAELLGGQHQRGSLAMTFRPTHDARVRLQGDVMASEAVEETILGVFLQIEVMAGSHPSHNH